MKVIIDVQRKRNDHSVQGGIKEMKYIHSWKAIIGALLVLTAVFTGSAVCKECDTCTGGGGVDCLETLREWASSETTTTTASIDDNVSSASGSSMLSPSEIFAALEDSSSEEEPIEQAPPERTFGSYLNPQDIVDPLAVSSADIIIDVGKGYYDANTHIKGAIPLYWDGFLDESAMIKSAPELAKVIGDAGISRDDPVIIYGDCPECGGKSVATFVFWVMRYLGHDDVKVLDGGIDSWKAAGLPVETTANMRSPVDYIPKLRPGLRANYDYVSSADVQLIDARTFVEYADGCIGDAVHIDYEQLLQNDGRFEDGAALDRLFTGRGLTKDKPIVVYSNAGAKASMVWYALQLMDYDASVYTWRDWLVHESSFDVELEDVRAEPNPVASGGAVKIYASLVMVQSDGAAADQVATVDDTVVADSSSEADTGDAVAAEDTEADDSVAEVESPDTSAVDDAIAEEDTVDESTSDAETSDISSAVEDPSFNDTKLTVMGCASCTPIYLFTGGVGPSTSEGVQLSSSKAWKSSDTSESSETSDSSDTSDSSITCEAIISNEGDYESSVKMIKTGDEYTGTWYAPATPGTYSVSIVVSSGGLAIGFQDVLRVEVTGSKQETSAPAGYTKLGNY